MDGAPQWNFSHWPRGIVGQIGGQDADPQLALWENTQKTRQKATNYMNSQTQKEAFMKKGNFT